MSDKRTEFPRLKERLAYLEHEYYSAQKLADDAVRANRPDNATQQWLNNTWEELQELEYVLRVISPQSRIDVTGSTLILYAIVMAAIVILLLRFWGL